MRYDARYLVSILSNEARGPHNAAVNGFNLWTLNGEAFSIETMKPLYKVQEGRRYRLKFRNASDDMTRYICTGTVSSCGASAVCQPRA